jgi:hypothetical protein
MAKKKKEKIVEKTTNEPKGDVTKVKEKMKKPTEVVGETITKVDLSKPPKTETDAVQERETEEIHVGESSGDSEEVGEGGAESDTTKVEEIKDESKVEDTPIVEEITNETEQTVEELAEQVTDAIVETQETGKELPENIQKLMDFMEDTGGDLNDYVALNQDYSKLDNQDLLLEHYKQTKPHLNTEEINFLMEDQFSYDEEMDDEKDIKRKKLAMKEQVAQARQHLDSVKSKYYEDIKSGTKLTSEQQEAIEFFNKHNEESERNYETSKKQSDIFIDKTNRLFNDKFKGFEYEVGDKKFRFNVKDSGQLKETQGDINNFIKKFLTKENTMKDAAGYHKGLFTAMNPDAVANHFYEQGKADALKDSIAKSKNVNMDPRQAHVENVNTSGFKARVLNDDGPDFKFKIKQK